MTSNYKPRDFVPKKKHEVIWFVRHDGKQLLNAAKNVNYEQVNRLSHLETQSGYDLVQCLESEDHCVNPICKIQQAFCGDMMSYHRTITEFVEQKDLPCVFETLDHFYQPAMDEINRN